MVDPLIEFLNTNLDFIKARSNCNALAYFSAVYTQIIGLWKRICDANIGLLHKT